MPGKNQLSLVPGTETLSHQLGPALSPPFLLTEREKEVIKLLMDGLTYRQIARQLDISKATVNSHMNNIYRKLRVNNRVQALRRVLEHSLA